MQSRGIAPLLVRPVLVSNYRDLGSVRRWGAAVRLVRQPWLPSPSYLGQVKASYEAILAALEKGDSRASGRLLQEHAASFAPNELTTNSG